MKLYEILIKPVSGFGTPLKGDTVFGHFCWQAANDDSLLNGGFDRWISAYQETPFVVFSSAYPKIKENSNKFYVTKLPDIPMHYLFGQTGLTRLERFEMRKENKKKKWVMLDEDLSLSLDSSRLLCDEELISKAYNQLSDGTKRDLSGKTPKAFCIESDQQHNSINRISGTTGEGMFAPYSETFHQYFPESELVIFALIDEAATDIERIRCAFERIGTFGFGKDASIGNGRFTLGKFEEIDIPHKSDVNACYTLAPAVPDHETFTHTFFTPFVRFGRHGDRLALSDNPFKNPVVMAGEGAVFIPNSPDVFDKPFIGQAVTGVSKTLEQTVHQGYAPYVPFKLEL